MPNGTQTTTLDGALAAAILAVVFDRVQPATPHLASVTDGAWEGLRFKGLVSEFEVRHGGSLVLRCFVRDGIFPHQEFDRRRNVLNRPSWFDLDDGSRVEVGLTHLAACGGTRCSEGVRPGVVLDLDLWTWNPSARSRLWFGQLEGADLRGARGNLTVGERVGDTSNRRHQNLRLDGQCSWHLLSVEGEDHATVVVVAPEGGASREDITHDFMAAQFALGRPLALDMLVGTDDDLRPVSAMGLRLGSRESGGHRCPVPETFHDPVVWKALLFERVARKLRDEGSETMKVPLGAYLDGATAHLDLAYLAGQVGLEAFARTIIGAPSVNLVKDARAWNDWVKANGDAILAHGLDAHASKKLLGKVTNAHQGQSSYRVQAALQHYGLDVPEKVVEEILRRDQSVHEYLMSGDEPVRDVLKDVDRRDTVLTLIAALVAKYVGYEGPIVGWDRDEGGNPLVPSWWPHRGDGGQRVRFICERER